MDLPVHDYGLPTVIVAVLALVGWILRRRATAPERKEKRYEKWQDKLAELQDEYMAALRSCDGNRIHTAGRRLHLHKEKRPDR